ncbi:MAG: DUF2723 domain-containing protein [Fidelibacterota bacterium]
MTTDKARRLLAGFVFLASYGVYFATMAPTVSYWDCGEFIATSHILGVPHPPGSPLYLIIGRIFSILPFGKDIAFRVNLISPLVSALAVTLLFLIIVQFVTQWRGPVRTREDRWVVFGSALVGSLSFAFTDSHWFNAVEAEVYAMSTLFTALVVWLILQWSERSDEAGNERYFLVISYVLGLASGVHLLNLLALPFMGLIIYFRKRKFSWPSFFAMTGVVAVSFLVVYLGVIKGFPRLASLVGVIGVVFLVAALFGFTILAIIRKRRLWSTVLSCLVLVVVGYSTYAMLFIRSGQNEIPGERAVRDRFHLAQGVYQGPGGQLCSQGGGCGKTTQGQGLHHRPESKLHVSRLRQAGGFSVELPDCPDVHPVLSVAVRRQGSGWGKVVDFTIWSSGAERRRRS